MRLGEPRRLIVVAVEAHVATGRDAIDNFLDSRGCLIAENFDTVLVVVPGVAVELEDDVLLFSDAFHVRVDRQCIVLESNHPVMNDTVRLSRENIIKGRENIGLDGDRTPFATFISVPRDDRGRDEPNEVEFGVVRRHEFVDVVAVVGDRSCLHWFLSYYKSISLSHFTASSGAAAAHGVNLKTLADQGVQVPVARRDVFVQGSIVRLYFFDLTAP